MTEPDAKHERQGHVASDAVDYLASVLARGFALFLGGFSLLNLAGSLRSANFDANLWWIDFRAFEPWVTNGLLAVASLFLLGYAFAPHMRTWRRISMLILVSLLLVESLANSLFFYRLLLAGTIHASIPIPFSIFIAAALALILFRCVRVAQTDVSRLGLVAVMLALAAIFPVLQMYCFGKTDYRRKADVAVIFGARVFASGKPSDALADRVRAGVQLYQEGLVTKLICSGGPGDGAVHETDAMKRMAIRLGVPERDIILDAEGVNTRASVANTEKIFAERGMSRVIVVSHFYHLPRIKMSYHRTGWEVYTVPAQEKYTLRLMPYFMAREVAALWVYYLRPLAVQAGQTGVG